MRRSRITIGGLMSLVVVLGVGFAALRSPTALWDSGLFTLALVILGTATLGAFRFRGRTRARWVGFAAFGFVYFGFTCGPWSETLSDRLLTSKILNRLDAAIHPGRSLQKIVLSSNGTVTSTMAQANPAGASSFIFTQPYGPMNIQGSSIRAWTSASGSLDRNLIYFHPVGHSLWTLIVAMLGGTIGGLLFGVAEQRDKAAKMQENRQIDVGDFSLSDVTAKVPDTTATTGLSG